MRAPPSWAYSPIHHPKAQPHNIIILGVEILRHENYRDANTQSKTKSESEIDSIITELFSGEGVIKEKDSLKLINQMF